MSKALKYFLVLLIACLHVAGISTAFASDKDFPAQPNPPRLVNDLAHFLSADEQASLEQKLRGYYDTTSTEIAVVTLESIGDYDIADYSVQLFNRWKIGGKKNNNGLLILVAKEQRKIWMTTGYGLEGALPDGLLGQIVREEMEPNFKHGDYYVAFDKAIDAIILAARGEYQVEPEEHHKAKGGRGSAFAVLLVFLIIIIASRGGGGGGGGGGLLNSAGWIAASMLSNRSRSSSSWGGFGGGSSSGGGFGGFGGGSSGGGGAGGGW